MQHFHASAPLLGIELSIATNSPNDSLSLSWVHSESLPSDSDKLSTSTLPSILVQVEKNLWSSSLGVYGSNIKGSSYFNRQSVL